MALLKSACIVAILACLTVAALRYMDLVDSFSFTDIVQLVSRPGYEYIGVAWTTLLSAFSNVPDSKPSHPTETDKIFTKEELQSLKYSYLAIVGEVFDVQSGSKHYGTDGHYNFFTGWLVMLCIDSKVVKKFICVKFVTTYIYFDIVFINYNRNI